MTVTREYLLETLRSIAANGTDKEVDHWHADQLLTDYIDDPEVTEAYRAIDKWYA